MKYTVSIRDFFLYLNWIVFPFVPFWSHAGETGSHLNPKYCHSWAWQSGSWEDIEQKIWPKLGYDTAPKKNVPEIMLGPARRSMF